MRAFSFIHLDPASCSLLEVSSEHAILDHANSPLGDPARSLLAQDTMPLNIKVMLNASMTLFLLAPSAEDLTRPLYLSSLLPLFCFARVGFSQTGPT